MKIKAEDFAKELGLMFDQYSEEIDEVVKEAVKQTASKCRKDIKAKAPVRDSPTGGKYKKSWKIKKVYDRRGGIRTVVYSASPHYRLTHLLENGHAKRNGGRVKAFPHIAPAAEAAERTLPELIKKGIEQIES